MQERDGTAPLRVLLCPDKPDWAFDNIARNIERHAGENRIFKLYMCDTLEQEHRFFEKILLSRIDICHVFWREDLFYLLSPSTIAKAARTLNFSYEGLVRSLSTCAFTTSVYDHLFSDQTEMRERRYGFSVIDGYTVSSQKLYSLYGSEPQLPRPDAVIRDGVDVEHFSPRIGDKANGDNHSIGWAGNSAWGNKSLKVDVKGFHRLFTPMLEALQAGGLKVEAKVADPQTGRIAFSDMPDFYRGLDVFVCTSSMEGTPNPLLEAMACGRPVVSTNVGIVPEVLGELQQRFIIDDADPEKFASAVAEILGNPSLGDALGVENRNRAMQMTWQKQTEAWWPFWRDALHKATGIRDAMRREAWLLSRG
ncbi:MAG: glycosyltransferase family 4 protein [Hyphomicrobiales bacterium]|nr:glycosyltransferase family 4 protein [Hyphomicrobiales bacterium]